MTLIDSRLEFSDAQSVTATAASTNVIDLSQDRNVGPGRVLYVVVHVDVAVGGTSPTYDIDLETDDNSAFSSATVIGSFVQITDTNGTAGAKFYITIPADNEEFLRLNYTVGGTSPTGTFSAYITDQEPYKHDTYADASN